MPQKVSPVIRDAFANALRHHQAGQLAEAERLYRLILQIDPRHSDSLHLLGLIAHQLGKTDVAIAMISKAIGINGKVAAYRYNLGNALHRSGHLDDAVAAFNAALRIKPDLAEAHSNLGNVLQDLGRFDEAVAAHNAALRIKPDLAEAHSNLGNVLQDLGRLDEAVAACNIALRLKPDFAEAYANLGNALCGLRRFDEAVGAYNAALRIKPDLAEAHSNLGNALHSLGRLNDAVTAHETALRIQPDDAEAHSNLGNALQDLGRIDDAIAACKTALDIKPDYAPAHSNLLSSLHYAAGIDRKTILTTARRFAEQFESKPSPSFSCSPDPDRRLRIGYVSGDFRRHTVGWFLNRVLANHDHAAMEIICYSNYPGVDAMTAQLRDTADHWRSLIGLSDDAAAALVAADGIDVLVDLSGHTASNRLPMFARKPAPVQVTWLGFWGTTGLSTMDYILSDAVTIPPDEEDGYSERVVRLPGGRFCYGPPDYAPPPSPPPCLRGGGPTFGSFNNAAKIGPEVVKLWAAVLHAVPGSRLLLKWKTMIDAGMRRRLTESFAAEGIDPQCLTLRGASQHVDMLAEYGDVDIALDPFPFCGGITSCEALWMGVPVVTLPGAGAASRQTLGFLQVLGLADWVAASPADYVRIAADLAADIPRLRNLRSELRSRIEASPLCDGARFTRDLERAYRGMWQAWCSTHAKDEK